MGKPKMPARLGPAGKALWGRLLAVYDLDPAEVLIVEAAARQADDVAALEAIIAEQGMITVGSAGQPRLAAVVTEVRQGRLAVAKLLGELALPAEEDQAPMTARSRRAQKAANARWDRRAAREA